MSDPQTTAPDPAATPDRGRSKTAAQRLFAFLTSPRLAIALLVGILAFCVVGVTALRGQRAWEAIFSTLWFNALLVLLALSSAAAFFTRIWRRKLTLVSVGMILFHLSFLAVLGGVVINSLFSFKGLMRLTEGETLPNGRLESYDVVERGRFFDPSWLRGETTLVRMHRDYKVGDENKRAAYELIVEAGDARAKDIIYIAKHLDFEGARYFCSKEGYSVLVVMTDGEGREVYGAHVPLQSLKQPDGAYLYSTGTRQGPAFLAFPQPPGEPWAGLLITFRPNSVDERAGEVEFQVQPLGPHGDASRERTGQVAVGATFDAGDFKLTPKEIRYWVGMDVRYDPGLTLILASLSLGLVGMGLTLVGRIRQGAARKRAA